MALLLREHDIREALTLAAEGAPAPEQTPQVRAMRAVVDVLEAAFRRQGQGQTRNLPRERIVMPEGAGVLHVLPAYVPGDAGDPTSTGPGFVGLKTYTATASGVRFLVLLFAAEDGRLLALLEADLLGRMRTGAATGVATRHLARAEASVLGIIGTGGQAFTQVLAVSAVRPLTAVHLYGRDADRCAAFAEDVRRATGLTAVEIAPSVEAVAAAADVLVTATSAREPVLHGSALRPGMHLNVMGSNWANRREVDEEAVARSDLVVVDALDQARLEAGDLLFAAQAGHFSLDRAVELGQVVAGNAPGRSAPEEITFFKSLGIGLEDIAIAAQLYALARGRGLGQEVPLLP